MTQLATERRRRIARARAPQVRVASHTLARAVAVLPPTTLLLLAIWLGLATGLIELVVFFVRWRWVDATALSALQLNQHALWMVPLSDAMIFAPCGLVLAIAVGHTRARWVAALGVYGLCFLSAFALLLTYRGLSSLATSALAAGIAFRITLGLLTHARRVRRLVVSSLPVLIGLVATFWILGPTRERIDERRLPPVRPGAPNVLFIVLDTVRAESLSLHGYGRDTSPRLRSLAETGVRFDQARAAGAWTLPSHASMFTGRWPHELSARLDRPLDSTYPTLAEFLRDHGYDTAGFVANTFFCSRWFGLSRGFLHYEDVAVNPAEILRSSGLGRALARKFAPYQRDRPTAYFDRKDAPTINREVLDWLADRPSGHPFFAFLNYYDTHDPYFPPEGVQKNFGRTPATARDVAILRDWHRISKSKLDPTTVELAHDCYDDCLAYLDEQLGRLFEMMDSRDLLHNTLIVVTADHGEEFGEHGGFGHGQSLYSQVIHVPLLVVAPGRVPSGQIIATPVSLRDLPATVVDLLGLAHDSPFPGRSLARHWQPAAARASEPDHLVLSEIVDDEGKVLSGSRPSRALVDDGKVYISRTDGREELYDLEADPSESRDLSGTAPVQPLLARFRAAVQRLEIGSARSPKESAPDHRDRGNGEQSARNTSLGRP